MEASGNYTLPNGGKFATDAKWKDVYPDFKMVDQNATEQATLANFMSESDILTSGYHAVNDSVLIRSHEYWYSDCQFCYRPR